MRDMVVRYDPVADAVYVSLQFAEPGASRRTKELGGDRFVDYSADGELLGVEFLWVSDDIDLDDVPEREEFAEALRPFSSP